MDGWMAEERLRETREEEHHRIDNRVGRSIGCSFCNMDDVVVGTMVKRRTHVREGENGKKRNRRENRVVFVLSMLQICGPLHLSV
ncbi:hypothetical protein M514_06853 [Trichuris suis]|uniref:Uncharacterized protein n=1 Tax=Trichuris suis TaxID=68888 RepID=A0A085NBA4_9BILA|nr:hypothetical protein M513_06853 [Trichuris suis]KFD66750.1 hypothetical protein M514_06853 [Trichuris suis]